MTDTFKIKDLAQVRLLSDPLKLRILQAFAERERTTKDVAAELDENVTRLYRHVDALHDAGLLKVTGERQKRGTIERTFHAVATRFEVDHRLFQENGDDGPRQAAREVLRSSEREILDAISASRDRDDKDVVLVRLRCKASPERIAELRSLLNDWIEAAQRDDDCSGSVTEEVGALVAFYPVSGGE